MEDAENITNCIFYAIDSIDDARWWCNKKNIDDYAIAIKLLQDCDNEIEIIKKIKKQYN